MRLVTQVTEAADAYTGREPEVVNFTTSVSVQVSVYSSCM